MGLYDSKTYLADLDREVEEYEGLFRELTGSSILITGASGLVCSPIADLIFRANEKLGTEISPFLAGRNEGRIAERFLEQKYAFVPYDATKKNNFNFHADYIIHGASNSGPKDITAHGIETMLDNFNGMYELLEYAEREKVKNTLYISSSEVYGKKNTIQPFSEEEYGWVDILSPRSSYASSKRAAETLCACFSDEKSVKTTTVRPGHIYGPTARRNDSHVSVAFSFSAADGVDLVLKSTGSQLRSWCYCLDSATSILTVLVKGETANAYNISNPDSVTSIKDMAELLAAEAGVKVVIDAPSEDEKKAFNPMENSSLNGQKLMNLRWHGLFDAKTGFGHTVKIIKEAGL